MSSQHCGFFSAVFRSRLSTVSSEDDPSQSTTPSLDSPPSASAIDTHNDMLVATNESISLTSLESGSSLLPSSLPTSTPVGSSPPVLMDSNSPLVGHAPNANSFPIENDDQQHYLEQQQLCNFADDNAVSRNTVDIDLTDINTPPSTSSNSLFHPLTIETPVDHTSESYISTYRVPPMVHHDQMEPVSSSTYVSPAGIEFACMAKPIISSRDRDSHTFPTSATLSHATRESEELYSQRNLDYINEASLVRQRQAHAYIERELVWICRQLDSLNHEVETLERRRYQHNSRSLVDRVISLRKENHDLSTECNLLSLESNARELDTGTHMGASLHWNDFTPRPEPWSSTRDQNITNAHNVPTDQLNGLTLEPLTTIANQAHDNEEWAEERTWPCPQCTFKNHYELKSCEMCNWPETHPSNEEDRAVN